MSNSKPSSFKCYYVALHSQNNLCNPVTAVFFQSPILYYCVFYVSDLVICIVSFLEIKYGLFRGGLGTHMDIFQMTYLPFQPRKKCIPLPIIMINSDYYSNTQ